ncbi:MAG: ATP-grasp domain-containing protein [Burkholderiaceae bacterium]
MNNQHRRRILILNRWPRFPNTERWDNELADYGSLIDHRENEVVYVCDRKGTNGILVDGIPPSHLRIFEDFHDDAALVAEVRSASAEYGAFDMVIAFSEHLLESAAVIREALGIPGPLPEEVARCRDKTLMKSIVSTCGLRVPRWIRVTPGNTAASLAQELGLPIIVKPVRGASSKGVVKADTMQALEQILQRVVNERQPIEVEEFIDAPIMHADGVIDAQGQLVFLSVARYISTCLDFESGTPLGSILQTDPDLLARVRTFAERCLLALGLRSSAFHLEFFETAGEFTFLEIGARVPGADVSYVVQEVRGYNLFRGWVEAMLERPQSQAMRKPTSSGGWLMVPRPRPLPCRVIAATSMRRTVPSVYRELIPAPGDWLEDSEGYANLQGGRFLFRAATPQAVEDAMRNVLEGYQLTVSHGMNSQDRRTA